MDAFLQETYLRLLEMTNLSWKRSLFGQFQLGRLTCLLGPRGVGKSTLMLQYIKEKLSKDSKVFYFSADSVYFRQSTLLAFINDLYRLEGYRIFFIDEIHKYENWNQELKNLYDAFPDIQIVYSGSSQLELMKGNHDLSRRVKLYRLTGMSFREYLNYTEKKSVETIELKALLENPNKFNSLGQTPVILKSFHQYLAMGYYPFVFEEPHTYYERVIRVVEKIIYEDIPNYFDLKTHNLNLFRKILSYLASVSPGEVNTYNIAKSMGVASQTISHYLMMLENVGLIQMVYAFGSGDAILRKPEKIFLHNTTLLHALNQFGSNPLNQGTLRELYFIQTLRDANHPLYYSQIGDYQTESHVFEIGGKNKKNKQILSSQLPAYLVKDDILTASQNTIPLLFFGFIA